MSERDAVSGQLAGPTMPLLGPKIFLTALRESDIERVVEACTTPEAEQFLLTPWPYERADAEFFVLEFAPAGWRGEHDERVWAIRESLRGQLCGVISLRGDARELGFWLHPDAQGRGLMTDAVRTLVGHAEGCLVWPELHWRCAVDNLASMRVAKAAGFSYLGLADGEGRGGAPIREHRAVRAAVPAPDALPWPDLG